MSDFYFDGTSSSEFLQRARGRGSLDGPETCPVSLLEWSPEDLHRPPPIMQTNARELSSKPSHRIRIIFAPLDLPQPRTALGIHAIFKKLSIPSDFVSQRLESVTHSFGATSENGTYSAWFHYLCKNINLSQDSAQPGRIVDPRNLRGVSLSQGDWTWFRTSVFLSWTGAHDFISTTVTLVIFSAPPELKKRFEALWNTDLTHVLRDPFSLLIICLDQLWRQAQGVYNNVREAFGVMETNTLTAAENTGRQRPHHDFVGLHNIAKHIIHLKESSQGSAATIGRLQEFHRELLKHPPQGQAALPATTLADQVLSQKVIQMDVWKLRMESLEKRVQNMINLAFNVVTQHDSQMMIQDSKSMRAIATVTVLFLPLATIAAIFGCQFFNFDSDQRKVVVAKDFWIFWALIGPSSIAVSLLYYYLCYIRGSQRDFFASRKAFKETFCF